MVTAPSGAGASRRKQVVVKPLTSNDLKKRRQWMVMAIGDEGTGKTHFCLTFLLYAYYELALEVEDCMVVMIDPDDGEARLLDVEVIPSFLQDRMVHFQPKNWKELMSATDQAYEILSKHVKDRGLRGWQGSMVVVENKGYCWDWAQDDYVQDVYNKTLSEKALDAKKIAVADDKTMHPTLNPMRDYGVINKKYDAWADGMRSSGFSFIWTAHLKALTVSKGEGKAEVVKEKCEGKRNIAGKVDVVIKFHQEDGKYLSDIDKGRGLSSRLENRENMDFSEFVRVYKLLQKNDKKRRVDVFAKYEQKRKQNLAKRKEMMEAEKKKKTSKEGKKEEPEEVKEDDTPTDENTSGEETNEDYLGDLDLV